MSAQQTVIRWLGSLTPSLQTSRFFDEGVLTWDEFRSAGDELVGAWGQWKWMGKGEEKQYLLARGLPCRTRASDLGGFEEVEAGDGWVETRETKGIKSSIEAKTSESADEIEDIPEISSDSKSLTSSKTFDEDTATFETAPEITSDGVTQTGVDRALEIQESDIGTLSESNEGSAFVKTRRYDISIIYDKYYRTPRVFLLGYGEHGELLDSASIMKDISAEHAYKTVTIECHPYTKVYQVSIHPCQHAHVMKKLVHASQPRIQVNRCLFLFLKFIATVIPTIEYDWS